MNPGLAVFIYASGRSWLGFRFRWAANSERSFSRRGHQDHGASQAGSSGMRFSLEAGKIGGAGRGRGYVMLFVPRFFFFFPQQLQALGSMSPDRRFGVVRKRALRFHEGSTKVPPHAVGDIT